MVCTTLIFPLLFPAVMLLMKRIPIIYNTSEYLLNKYIVWGLSIHLGIAVVVYGTAIFQMFSSSIMANGWLVDLLALLVVAIAKVDTYDCNPVALLPNVLLFNTFGINNKSKEQHQANITGYIMILLASISQIVLWLPMVSNWSSDHCLLDGFLDTSNLASSYVVCVITAIYFKMMFTMLNVQETVKEDKTNNSKVIKFLLISIVAFYNITWGGILVLM